MALTIMGLGMTVAAAVFHHVFPWVPRWVDWALFWIGIALVAVGGTVQFFPSYSIHLVHNDTIVDLGAWPFVIVTVFIISSLGLFLYMGAKNRRLGASGERGPTVTSSPPVTTALDELPSIVDCQFAEKLLERITVQDVYSDRDTNMKSSTVFRLKLRIVLRNDTGKDLEARASTWMVEFGDVPSLGNKTPLQVEGKDGWEQNSWLPESSEVYVLASRAFRAWIPFDPSLSEDEIRRRHETKRLGILALPVRIVGHDVTLKRRF